MPRKHASGTAVTDKQAVCIPEESELESDFGFRPIFERNLLLLGVTSKRWGIDPEIVLYHFRLRFPSL